MGQPHIGKLRNGKTDEMAKEGASRDPEHPITTEGGVKQAWKELRSRERKVKGTGMGSAIRWNWKALLNFSHCRTGKGRLGVWKHLLNPWSDPTCRMCREDQETGNHIALSCPEGEWLGRRWSSWEQMDEKERWMRKEKDGDRVVVTDIVEDFLPV